VQANAPAASYWLRRVLDDDGRHRARGAGRRGRSLQCTIALFCIFLLHALDALFIPGIFFFGGGEFPSSKKITTPPNGCQIVCSKSFFGRENELQLYHENFVLIDNKYRKLFIKGREERGDGKGGGIPPKSRCVE